MTIHMHNPPELFTPRGFSHVTVGSGQKVVFVSGQAALDAEGTLVGAGDLGAQARQAFRNLVSALGSVGTAPTDIAKMTWYVPLPLPGRRRSASMPLPAPWWGCSPLPIPAF